MDQLIKGITFLTVVVVSFFYASLFLSDIFLVAHYNQEVKAAVQTAATYGFSTLSLEQVSERKSGNRGYRYIVLNKPAAEKAVKDAIDRNLKADHKLEYLLITDSTDGARNVFGVSIDEPVVAVQITIPIKFHFSKKDSITYQKIVPLWTFITNQQTK